ncbi:MAG: shikimate dehydrogenase [Paracoccus sp. (in: a-proteobacteria)]|uniref:shikimate dehydrogenase family protein n=1 Tax=Paracoccus sp. TaxID=267 RepID=UPI0026DFE48A|nr:shikimate dehydrogenase [Paracoccus sp. (in: a-proteobacteria)]MDO5631224.1 shikimate dehydrogenase [Paracoccus sp. (in: a-proteobacteria)]
MISGYTKILPHIGVPTESFKAPMIYNPWFQARGIDAVVVPMGCEVADFATFLPHVARLRNFAGALITMPHKVPVVGLLDEVSVTVQICGACNAVRRNPDGRLIGDMFDGEGFVRGVLRKGRVVAGASALVVGSGGVGSAIAASLAKAGAARIGLFDLNAAAAEGLAGRIRAAYPVEVVTGSNDPAGWDIVVNATPLGMNPGDPMPMDMARLSGDSFVGEVVMKQEETAFLAAARALGCQTQIGTDMLFEQIPAYLEFFGYPTTTPEELRSLAQIKY